MAHTPSKAERTKAALGEAVISLLRELPLERITADDIAKRAGMGRATWFRHFSSKQDAVECALFNRWERWAQERGVARHESRDARDIKFFLDLVYEQRETLAMLYKSGLRSAVINVTARISQSYWAHEQDLGYRVKFYTYGFVGIVDEWAEREFADTPDEVAALLKGSVSISGKGVQV